MLLHILPFGAVQLSNMNVLFSLGTTQQLFFSIQELSCLNVNSYEFFLVTEELSFEIHSSCSHEVMFMVVLAMLDAFGKICFVCGLESKNTNTADPMARNETIETMMISLFVDFDIRPFVAVALLGILSLLLFFVRINYWLL